MAASINRTMVGGKLCCLCLSKPYICRKSLRRSLRLSAVTGVKSGTVLHSKASPDVEIDVELQEKLRDNQLKHRLHPGVLKVKAVSLPEQLQNSVKVMLEKYPFEHLVPNAEKFSRYLKCRHPPAEEADFRKKAVAIEENIRQKELGDKNIDALDSDERQLLESKVKGKTLRQLRKQVYHWERVEYTAYKGFLYMVGKMDHDYAALIRCLNEIRSREAGFIPRSVFDYGSGVGSVIWGVDQMWKGKVTEYYCVDHSGEMNTLARLLLQDGEDNKAMRIPGVYFRQFHPSSQHKFDLTVSAFTLFEFPNQSDRLKAVKDLWDMTEEFMILLENSSVAGFNLIQEAREYILKAGDTETHVFAPCPHDQKCPKMSWTKNSACSFEVKYNRLQLSLNTVVCDKARFSYVILRKGQRRSECISSLWPRLVKRSTKPHNHTPCTVCCPDGTIKSVTITATKHSKDLYKCSRYCHLGDLLPATITEHCSEGLTDSNHGNLYEVDQSEKTVGGGSDSDSDHNAPGLCPGESLTPS